ncbi:hypothetical protein CHLRE_01g000033v5 [Chlamydomonas reinhardtii]|uniref:Uncharacterized protein n=1 Tax=Chlamydomonas reinhardtii TaxID=3055 RepID=A0A2K3E4S8_CHLRE|nr:uncharacterized protein CHLRE_01g000033v5 [Chlamydomonas reinhardtii]PNW87737.1 hypothetical protein CHLRE_01g000033v5 [Chlamydomonas reinhardtii]
MCGAPGLRLKNHRARALSRGWCQGPAGGGVPACAVRPAYASRTTVRALFPAAGVKAAGGSMPACAVRPAYASRTAVHAPFPAAGVKAPQVAACRHVWWQHAGMCGAPGLRLKNRFARALSRGRCQGPAGGGVPARQVCPAYASRTAVHAPFPAAGAKTAGGSMPARQVCPAYASRTTVRAPFPAAGVKAPQVAACRHVRWQHPGMCGAPGLRLKNHRARALSRGWCQGPAGGGVPACAVRPAYASRTTVRALFPAAGVKAAGGSMPACAVRPAYASRTAVHAPFPAAGVKAPQVAACRHVWWQHAGTSGAPRLRLKNYRARALSRGWCQGPAGGGVPARLVRLAYASRTALPALFLAAGVKAAGGSMPAHPGRPAYASRTTVHAPFPAAGVKAPQVAACRHVRWRRAGTSGAPGLRFKNHCARALSRGWCKAAGDNVPARAAYAVFCHRCPGTQSCRG